MVWNNERMTAPAMPPRPRQVTLAATLIMGGSVLVVLTVFDRLSGLRSLETREAIEKFLAEPPGNDLGLGVQSILEIMRVFGMVAAGCATAAAILGYQVLRRSRSARLALTLLAVPLFLSGMVTGGFLSSVVAAAAVMLWFQPSRDWFNGVVREPQATPAEGAGRSATTEEDRGQAPPSGVPTPRAYPGFGAPPDPSAFGGEPRPSGASPVTDPSARPPAVLWASVLTWVCTSLAVLVMASSIAVLAVDPSFVFDELQRQNPELAEQGVSEQALRTGTFALGGAVIVWSLAAALLAVLVFRRVSWARVALVVSAAVSAGLLLIGAVVQLLLVLPFAASVVVLALLIRPDVRAWFD
jgi:hypothetical protein